RRPAPEFPHRIRVPIRRHRYIVALVAHVNPSGVGMNDCQPGIGHRHLPPQLSSLFPVQTTTFQPLKSGHPAFRHGLLLKSAFRPGLGPALEKTPASPARSGRAFFKALARHQSMHRGSRSHAVKRAQGTNRTSTIACRPSLVTIKSESRRRFKFLAQYIAPQGTRLLLTTRWADLFGS